VIDPLAVPDLDPLKAVFEGGKEIILHDADSDLRILDRDHQLHAARVFDTRVAAQLLGEPGIGLAALLQKYFAIEVDKRYQRADWSLRPLSPEMLEYAAADTRYLPQLRDRLEAELIGRGRWAWAEEEFASLGGIRWTPKEAEEDPALRIKGVRALGPEHQDIARALYEWRDDKAKRLDRAVFRVMGNEHLMELATAAPRDLNALRAVPRFPSSIASRYGDELVQAIVGAANRPPTDVRRRPGKPRSRPDPAIEERLTRLKVLRSASALELGIEPGVLCPNATLMEIAAAWSGNKVDLGVVAELRKWQRGALGDDRIRQALAG
jgi:ribonuclease D